MIVWINGAFGAGKTTTAALVAAGLEDVKVSTHSTWVIC